MGLRSSPATAGTTTASTACKCTARNSDRSATTTTKQLAGIRDWMTIHAPDFDTATELTEAAADTFGVWNWLDEPDHAIWDLALDAMEAC